MGIEIEVTASDQWKNKENFINPTKARMEKWKIEMWGEKPW